MSAAHLVVVRVVELILLVSAEPGVGRERDRLWLVLARRRNGDPQLRRAEGRSDALALGHEHRGPLKRSKRHWPLDDTTRGRELHKPIRSVSPTTMSGRGFGSRPGAMWSRAVT